MFAFPACHRPSDESSVSDNIDKAFSNIQEPDVRHFGDLFLVEGIMQEKDKANTVSGKTISRIIAQDGKTIIVGGELPQTPVLYRKTAISTDEAKFR